MSILSNPKILYFTRIVQLLFGIGFLILICWSGTHRGWWTNINGPLAVGVITSIFTFALTLHVLITHHLKKNPFSGGSTVRTITRLTAEVIVFLLWIATAVLMLRTHAGCGYNGGDYVQEDGVAVCRQSDKKIWKWSEQPTVQWDLAVAFDFIEFATFLLTGFLVFKEDRESKGSGEASYA